MVCVGLSSVVLFVTGLIMWWNRVLRKKGSGICIAVRTPSPEGKGWPARGRVRGEEKRRTPHPACVPPSPFGKGIQILIVSSRSGPVETIRIGTSR